MSERYSPARTDRARHDQPPAAATDEAQRLLDRLRLTPMRRGAVSRRLARLRTAIAGQLVAQRVDVNLARRIALQLVVKYPDRRFSTETIAAMGWLLQQESAWLRAWVGLTERQIVAALPKLSAGQVQDLLEELSAFDRTIARTIFNAALEAADPVSAGRRYLAEYRRVASQVRAVDPTVARTLANATFSAGEPPKNVIEFVKRFSDVVARDGGACPSNPLVRRRRL